MNNLERLDKLSAEQVVIGLFLQDEDLKSSVVNYILAGNSLDVVFSEDAREKLSRGVLGIPLTDTLTHILVQEGSFFHVIKQVVQILNKNEAQRINRDNIIRYLNTYEAVMEKQNTFRYVNLPLSIYENILSRLGENSSAEERFIFGVLAGNNTNEIQHQLLQSIGSFFLRLKKTFGFSFKNKSEVNRSQEVLLKCYLINNFTDIGMPIFKFAS